MGCCAEVHLASLGRSWAQERTKERAKELAQDRVQDLAVLRVARLWGPQPRLHWAWQLKACQATLARV